MPAILCAPSRIQRILSVSSGFKALLRGIRTRQAEKTSWSSLTGSALCRLVGPTLTASADSSSSIPPSYGGSSTEADEEVSQGNLRNLHPITRRIYNHSFRMTIGLWNPMLPRPRVAASYTVPVRRAGTLPTASFRFHLAMDTLAVQLTIPVIGAREGLSPPVIRQAPRLPEQRYRATHYAWRTSSRRGPRDPHLSQHRTCRSAYG